MLVTNHVLIANRSHVLIGRANTLSETMAKLNEVGNR